MIHNERSKLPILQVAALQDRQQQLMLYNTGCFPNLFQSYLASKSLKLLTWVWAEEIT